MASLTDVSRTDQLGRAYAGSQKQIQTYVNGRTQVLNSAIARALSRYDLHDNDIHWVSPLATDKYLEYRDSEFVERVRLGHLAPQLQEFWPQRGPCWDALARIQGGCLLVEAKSHVPEIYGDGCGARSPKSKHTIQTALAATKAWLGVASDADWMGRLYQSANRYASLYFLRDAGIQAFLVNVYFIDDPRTPTNEKDWDVAIEHVNRELGLVSEVPHSASVFLAAG
jgi:hypothetical protein